MHLLIFGLGYSGAAIARLAASAGHAVTATARDPSGITAIPEVAIVRFDAAGGLPGSVTHVLSTVPPGDQDPVLRVWGARLLRAQHLRWAGYLSTTGVYGDRGGASVDERTPPAPGQPRSVRRLAAEQAWRDFAGDRVALDLFRTAGIYGPGRSAFDDLRGGRARRIGLPGHVFCRIHRDDIAGAVLAAAGQQPPGTRVLHLSDDIPDEPARVTGEAASLLGIAPPPLIPFEQAALDMSEMARSFWAENRRVESRLTQEWLDRPWCYPSYREGLRAILMQER